MSKLYQVRPSEIMGINDEYVRFCFDEACAFISVKIENGEQIQIKKKYSSFSEIYKQYK